MMRMLLTTSKYTFKIDYLPGMKNILADFGTCQIDASEWDKQSPEDQEGLHQLFCFDQSLPTPRLDFASSKHISDEDQIQISSIDRKA